MPIQFPKIQSHSNQNDGTESYTLYQRDSDIYQRIAFSWKESETLRHQYHAVINVNTGEIYIDCSKRKIFLKHLTTAFARPFHAVLKTLYHASIIAPLAVEIFKCATGPQTAKNLGLNMVKSLFDIVRTPLYGLAMTVVTVAGVLAAPFSPNVLYKTREIVGRLEKQLLWGANPYDNFFALTPCFTPVNSIQRLLTEQEISTLLSLDTRRKSVETQEKQVASLYDKISKDFYNSNECSEEYKELIKKIQGKKTDLANDISRLQMAYIDFLCSKNPDLLPIKSKQEEYFTLLKECSSLKEDEPEDLKKMLNIEEKMTQINQDIEKTIRANNFEPDYGKGIPDLLKKADDKLEQIRGVRRKSATRFKAPFQFFIQDKILFLRTNRVPFNGCWTLHPKNEAYISPVALTALRAAQSSEKATPELEPILQPEIQALI